MFYLCLSLSFCWGNLRILFKELWKKTLKLPKKKSQFKFSTKLVWRIELYAAGENTWKTKGHGAVWGEGLGCSLFLCGICHWQNILIFHARTCVTPSHSVPERRGWAGQGRAANRGQVAKRCWHRRVAKRARQLQVEPRFNRLFKWMTLKNL